MCQNWSFLLKCASRHTEQVNKEILQIESLANYSKTLPKPRTRSDWNIDLFWGQYIVYYKILFEMLKEVHEVIINSKFSR